MVANCFRNINEKERVYFRFSQKISSKSEESYIDSSGWIKKKKKATTHPRNTGD